MPSAKKMAEGGGGAIQRKEKKAAYFTAILPGGVELDLVYIPGGTFLMGAPETEKYSRDTERPVHKVTVPSFYMGKYPVTQQQWRAVASLDKIDRNLNLDPSYFKGDFRPVECVNWLDTQEFCARLSIFTGKKYRLPSEAEWEYAARAGTQTPFYFGDTLTSNLANYNASSSYTFASEEPGENRETTIDVGQFPPNAFGLYDIHGQLYEWCLDTWQDNYKRKPKTPNGFYVVRGGSWSSGSFDCPSAFRDRFWHDESSYDIGFRVVIVSEI